MNERRQGSGRGLRTSKTLAIAFFLALVVIAAPAFADDSYNKMLELSGEASQAFREGNIEQAAEKFAEAYSVYPEPVMLKNQMIARFALKDCTQAMTLGQRFMATAQQPSEEDIEDVHGVFAECGLQAAEAAMDEGNTSLATKELEEATPYFFTEEQAQRGQTLRDAMAKDSAEPEPPSVKEEPTRARTLSQPLGIGLSALGGATLIGNSIWYVSARSKRAELDEVAQAGTDPARFEELQSSLVTANWAIPTLYVVGTAALGTGLYFLFFHDRLTSGNAVILPQASPDGFGATLHMNF